MPRSLTNQSSKGSIYPGAPHVREGVQGAAPPPALAKRADQRVERGGVCLDACVAHRRVHLRRTLAGGD
eukprot:7906710-Pyramimonas_sp.AAC.1